MTRAAARNHRTRPAGRGSDARLRTGHRRHEKLLPATLSTGPSFGRRHAEVASPDVGAACAYHLVLGDFVHTNVYTYLSTTLLFDVKNLRKRISDLTPEEFYQQHQKAGNLEFTGV